MKKILLTALTALGLASLGGGAPAVAASRPNSGGEIEPAVAGGLTGGVLRDGGEAAPAIAGGAVRTGDIDVRMGIS